MILKPINNHLLIDPAKYESFITSGNETYEEIGVVLEVANNITDVKKGDRVYFDGWLAAKYPKFDGETDSFLWLVKYEDIRAVEHEQQKIPE